MVLNLFVKWLVQKKQKVDPLTSLLLRWENSLNIMLTEMKINKNYDKLQILEETIRRGLLKTLEVKGEVGTTMVKKDFEMNKELLQKIQAQTIPVAPVNPVTQTKPRFGNLN